MGSCCQNKYPNQKIQNKLVEYVQLKKRRERGHDFTTNFIFCCWLLLPINNTTTIHHHCEMHVFNQQSFTYVCVLFYCTICILGCCCCSRNSNPENRNKNGYHGNTSIYYWFQLLASLNSIVRRQYFKYRIGLLIFIFQGLQLSTQRVVHSFIFKASM